MEFFDDRVAEIKFIHRANHSLDPNSHDDKILEACSMSFDSKKQRQILGHFATGVTVVTTGGIAGLHGMTANAVASLSLKPPLVLVAVDKRQLTLDYLTRNRCFAVNILRLEQEELSRRFAARGRRTSQIWTSRQERPAHQSWLVAWRSSIARLSRYFRGGITRFSSERFWRANMMAASRYCITPEVIEGSESGPAQHASDSLREFRRWEYDRIRPCWDSGSKPRGILAISGGILELDLLRASDPTAICIALKLANPDHFSISRQPKYWGNMSPFVWTWRVSPAWSIVCGRRA